MNFGWEIDAYGSHGSRLTACLEAAALAPSVHNSQPWRFQVSPGQIDVVLDPDRVLRAIDPRGREAWISVGAALLNLRVAVLAAGRVPMSRLLPDPRRPELAATVTIGAPYRPDPTVHALAGAIPRRRTNRRPFRDIEVRDEVLDQLITAARSEGATLAITDPVGREAVLSLAVTANHWQRTDAAYVEELRTWTAVPPGSTSGIPARSLGPVDARGSLPLRDFGVAHPEATRRVARFEDAPTVAILYTTGDEPQDWLRAGQAMQRALLTATVRGVANTPITAPTEQPELRALLGDDDMGHVAQLILRLGYGEPVPPTPRRPIAELVDVVEAPRRPSVEV
jgi:nitroreductase